ncbi:MAG: N-6 DNA methylase [Corynebacterium sp.]|nr:N-6 DNA methylase [Corynebacterium sp.]
MARLSYKTIESNVAALAGREEYTKEIIFELLAAYGRSKASITTLRQGRINVAAHPEADEVAQKEVVYFQPHPELDGKDQAEREAKLLAAVEALRTSEQVVRYKTRFLIATDYELLAAVDTKTKSSTVFPLTRINKQFAFFLPWAGMEKAQFIPERPADTKAAEKMGKLFDALVEANPEITATAEARHSLNIFFTRLLFCYFAEDTNLFPAGVFTKAIASNTLEDGSDTAALIAEIFEVLDLPYNAPRRAELPAHLQVFPYVNGSLFSHDAGFQVPAFDINSRSMLIELGRMIWQDINPDIFGSMFQAVVGSGQRSELGQHYTSVPNILKTIEPLFYDELLEEFDKAYDKPRQLEKLLDRMGAIKIFDPACGSGNFLVIAYKQLRKLEHAVLTRLAILDPKHQTLFTDSVIKVEHFYGIEIDDFAAEIATLALWIAKHQMNQEYKEKFGVDLPLIPLKAMAQIHRGNATRVNWEELCPHDLDEEVYVIGK